MKMIKDLIFIVVLSAFIANIKSQEIHFPTSDDNPAWQLKYESMFLDAPIYSIYGMIGLWLAHYLLKVCLFMISILYNAGV
jgi:hypothetical protein